MTSLQPGAPPHGGLGRTTARCVISLVDGQARGVVGASLDQEFELSFATADGKKFWLVRKLTVP